MTIVLGDAPCRADTDLLESLPMRPFVPGGRP
jgi:hypothetical protein